MRWAGPVTCMEEMKGVYRVLVDKSDGKIQRGRPRRRWEDIIKTDLQDVGCGGMDWTEVFQNRERLRKLLNAGSIKCGDFLACLRTG